MALPPPKLDKRTTDKLNLQVLQRVDPDVEEVLVTAGHVALYHLDVPKMQWVGSTLQLDCCRPQEPLLPNQPGHAKVMISV